MATWREAGLGVVSHLGSLLSVLRVVRHRNVSQLREQNGAETIMQTSEIVASLNCFKNQEIIYKNADFLSPSAKWKAWQCGAAVMWWQR